MTGQTISHYRVTARLGAGGMGEVFLAEDTRLRRKVALKVLPENVAQDKDRLLRFEREAFAASALNHPNILTIYEFAIADGLHFIATEFVEGETLREKLSNDELTLREAVEIAEQIASALSAAYAAGIVHRDIKPENIMLRRDGFVKVLDFGLAKLTEKKELNLDSEAETRALVKTNPGVVMGTALYMSPEQARGKETDARTDIWSLGCVLYEMVSGEKPFGGETTSDVIASILKTEPALLSHFVSGIPTELEKIVSKCLRKKPDERYQNVRDLCIDLKDLRQELEFQTKLERTASPNKNQLPRDYKSGEAKTQILESEKGTDAANAISTKGEILHSPASSAEYITTKIKRHKFASIVALIVLLLAIGGLGYWFFASRPAGAPHIESIAVLPFVNESGNVDIEYLSDGMTETLISSLSQLPNFNVKARSSVFRYKGKEIDARTIGKELNAQAILNGRVVQRGQDLILYLELVDAATENVLWKENYNKSMANLVSLQTEIARDVSQKLKTKLSGADEQRLKKSYTNNAEAYQLYLRGRFHWNKRTEKDILKAIEYFNQAIAIDSSYALAYTGLAAAYSILPGYSNSLPRETMPKAQEFALKALALDNDLAEAHAALGNILTSYNYDFAGAEREYQRAIDLNPNYATARQWYGELLNYIGRYEESLAQFQQALELDPYSIIINRVYGEILFRARKYDESIAQLKTTIEIDPNFAHAYRGLFSTYQAKRAYPESVEALARYFELSGNYQDAASGRKSFVKGGWKNFLLAMTGERRPPNLPANIVAGFFGELGEKDKALIELERAYNSREFYIVLIKADPHLDSLRDDPRFQELVRKVGFSE